MKNKSIWLDNIKKLDLPKIDTSMKVDVLIIGGGITGISTAYHLINQNLDVCLVERNLIGHGITSKTTGKLTYLQENIYSKLEKNYSFDIAQKYLNSQKYAIKLVENIINKNNIKCDFKNEASCIFTCNNKDIYILKNEEKILKKLKVNINSINNLIIPHKYAISVPDTAVFHPLKYLTALTNICLKNGIKMYENSNVTKIIKKDNRYECTINNNIITTNKIVIATHYLPFTFPFLFPCKTYLEKSYISANKTTKICNISAITVGKEVKSIRYHQNYLIFLNGSHNLCTNYDYQKNFHNLLNELTNLKLNPDYIWSNHDIMTSDNMPYIGYIDDNLLIGTGYNTWGMTNGSLAGKIISDLILNKCNIYTELFNPKRNINMQNYIKYPLYIGYSAKSFIQNKIIKNKTWYKNNVKFETRNGKNIAIYTDEQKKEHIVYNLCPHLKCSLLFNEQEKQWECPCHGSTFDIDGKCITGPSNYNITYEE